MNRGIKSLILVIGSICLLSFAIVWIIYYFSIQRANKEGLEMVCKEYMTHEFEGQIISINTFDYNNFMHGRFFNLHIRINDSTKDFVDYQYNLKQNKEILEFVKVGQKAIKVKGEDTYTLLDSAGEQRIFKIANCAKIE